MTPCGNGPSLDPDQAVENDLPDTDRLRCIAIVVSDDPDHWLMRLADEIDHLREEAR